MYKEHRVFNVPEKSKKIWRYMDFTKFIDLLESNSLFLTRTDRFNDKFEGSYPSSNRRLRKEVYLKEENGELMLNAVELLDGFVNWSRPFTFINCWHLNEYESAGMWDLYLKSNEGIAIQSNVGRLIESLNDTPEVVYLGKVDYIDFKNDWMPEGNMFYPFLHKRKSFEHEKEIRLVHQDLPVEDKKGFDYSAEPTHQYGKSIKVDINTLIENIYVSPEAPFWFYELTKKLVEKYNLNKNVFQSELSELP
ncbi:hypothetical protein [Lysinibacillus sp. K60]|uniref:hypothetical protein n=1 Tax=Lysinibacillus sp. K60 TaxID=2720027 RepID=UPI001C8C6491|nr:hypothetical protein [Lysinibacillus sp. K60]MBX8942483.1 hypothetical protein [Lysinibacillus sp. K60]